MLKRTRLANAVHLACGSALALTALGAAAQSDTSLGRVEITGSAIKRIDAETAVPVTVIKADDLKKQGLTTVEQVMTQLSAVQTQQGTSQTVGSGTGGASFADLRGIGANKTLVLLNGRRVANNAIDSSAPDLNLIPFAALDRVEVLRDGASSLYGTDAIGGVINFITRKEVIGGTVTLGLDTPRGDGGRSRSANATYGFGNLDTDRFNVFGVVDYQNQSAITGTQRDFSNRTVKPSPTSYPGTYYQEGDSVTPGAPGCNVQPFGVFDGAFGCAYNTARWVDYVPKNERLSALLKGTVKITDDHQFNLEYFGSKSKVSTVIAPVPYGALSMAPFVPDANGNPTTTPNRYFPGNGITPLPPAGAAGFDLTQPITVRWRDVPNGPRGDQNDNTQQRVVGSFDGTVAGWDYQAALSYNQNRITQKLISGYTDGTKISDGVATGVINPFGDQDADGQAFLDSANALGTLQTAKGTVKGIDAHASREIGDWLGAGRAAAIAVGAEFRREEFQQIANADYAALVQSSTGFDPATNNRGSRNVSAAYTELNVPILKSLDVTGALRYDRYSDFGSTTNPKLSFRFQPLQEVLFRGSVSTGFRAPSLYELNAPQTYTNTANTWDDPVRCPNGTPIPGASKAANCSVQFQALNGGNPNLKPEKSKSATLGVVFEPATDLSVSVDFWKIKLRQQINSLTDNTVFSDPATFAAQFARAPNGSLSTDGSQCPGANCGSVILTTQNLGEVHTDGLDIGANYRLRLAEMGNLLVGMNTTYVHKYEYQDFEGGPFNQNVGVFSGAGPIFRWQSTATAAWSLGDFGAGAAAHWKTGYTDQDLVNHVPSYTTWDMYGSWQALKALSLTLGIRNVFDRDPPISFQASTFQTGYDPRFADPTGRTIYVRGTYAF